MAKYSKMILKAVDGMLGKMISSAAAVIFAVALIITDVYLAVFVLDPADDRRLFIASVLTALTVLSNLPETIIKLRGAVRDFKEQ